jgi:hypothetical protein
MKKLVLFFSVIISLTPSPSLGDSIKSKLQVGAGGYDESLTGAGDFVEGSQAKKTLDWFWSAELEFSEAPTITSVGTNIQEHSYAILPQMGIEPGNGFGVQSSYNYSYTPEESLVSSGPELDFFYTFEGSTVEPSENSEKIEFSPTLKLQFGGKDLEYVQTFNGSTVPGKNGVTRPTTGFNNLREIAAITEVATSPWEFLSFGITYTYFFYDRNVANFLTFIDAPGAARLGAGGFSNSITNFSQSTLDFTATLYPIDKWSLDLELINSVSAVDISLGWSYQAVLNREFGNLTAGLGAEHDTSPFIGDNYYFIFELGYEFD